TGYVGTASDTANTAVDVRRERQRSSALHRADAADFPTAKHLVDEAVGALPTAIQTEGHLIGVRKRQTMRRVAAGHAAIQVAVVERVAITAVSGRHRLLERVSGKQAQSGRHPPLRLHLERM